MPQDDFKSGPQEGRGQIADRPPVAMDGQTVVASDPAAELQQYREFVERVASERSGELIFNRSESHAAIVVEYLFRTATCEINILTQRLYTPVYSAPELFDAAKDFLSKPTARLNIISEEEIQDDHPLIKGLLDAGFGQKVSRRMMTPEAVASTPFDFAVADGACFRFEPDKKSMAALVKFGDETFGKTLAEKFQEIPTRKAA